tara:strand:+ start:5883 stop:6683 length:801 start_codon:yes stop_codon:yes gene_type:complete
MVAANANTSTAFQRCHPKTAQWEGGWSNHKDDPGGPTMGGVTQPVFDEFNDRHGRPRRPVAAITRLEAERLFFEQFWLKAGCDRLFPGVDLATYDAAVNSGVSRGRKWLLASLDPANDHAKTVKNICSKRLGFVQTLKIWQTFGKGWSNRIADIEATGVAWALAAMSASDKARVVTALRDEQDSARKIAANQTKGAATSGVSGTGAGAGLTVDPAHIDQAAAWLLGGLMVAGLLLGGYLLVRVIINRQRAHAYDRAAESAVLTGAV